MGKMLAPPLLDGTIPAFYSTDQGIVITIPFSMNRVVSLNQVKGFQVKIKTVQSGTQLWSGRATTYQNNKVNFALSALISTNKVINELNYTTILKAQKNECEVKNAYLAHIKDGVAVTKFI